MILDSPVVDAGTFAERTGWVAKPEGLCKAEMCVPAPGADRGDGSLDVGVVADRLRMPLLHDDSYNIRTGNPYKELVGDLMKRGVKIELCGATAKAHNWGNDDLLPGIKINTDAMARTTQLVQEGFVKITE